MTAPALKGAFHLREERVFFFSPRICKLHPRAKSQIWPTMFVNNINKVLLECKRKGGKEEERRKETKCIR